MYNPPHFKEERVEVLHELIRRHPLATLVTLGPDGLTANHIPLEIDPEPAPFGTLRGHVARANPVWRIRAADVDTLVIFSGPQRYITPAWYATKQVSGKVVPTWNYVVVHAHGPLHVIDDRAWLRSFVTRLTDRHESARAEPWRVTDAPADFVDKQLAGIVGIEVPVRRLEGKWKVSQNRDPADRAGVVAGLRGTDDPAGQGMADLIARIDAAPPD
jgi:transcriptional regulator